MQTSAQPSGMAESKTATTPSRPRTAPLRTIPTVFPAASRASPAPILKSSSARHTLDVSQWLSHSFSAKLTAERMDIKAEVTLEKVADRFAITAVDLTLKAKVPVADQAKFSELAAKAKAGCPVSKLLNAKITLTATLRPAHSSAGGQRGSAPARCAR